MVYIPCNGLEICSKAATGLNATCVNDSGGLGGGLGGLLGSPGSNPLTGIVDTLSGAVGGLPVVGPALNP